MSSNRLATQTSPYLLQHAHNPVHWYPWGPEALERARLEDKPIFLSIGYAACHWCHVMERESFEDPGIAEFLNRYFVAIKVDREERPDIDDIYMAATVAISGSGGWPMSVFLTADQRPFFAGTYFPPTDRYGRPGFLNLLTKIAELWNNERESLFGQAEQLTAHVQQLQAHSVAPGALHDSSIAAAVAHLAESFDTRWGGFGSAPKFPPHQALGLLLRHHRRTGDAQALSMLTKTLDGMKNGGMYDHLAGGFARYSTDQRWLAPHFEKMLYDNAQLVPAYLEGYQVTGDEEYRRVAAETLDYVLREMQGAEGGYFSATDADSEGEEGKFFVFLPEEIDDILGRDDAEAFCLHYDITVGGNWEGKNILNTPRPLARTAEDLGMAEADLAQLLERCKAKVYDARQQRVPPLLDDKVLTAWNGLMIGAMAEGHRVLRDSRYLESARRAARFVLGTLRRPDGALLRTARAGKAHIDGFLEDYAYLADGLLSLYETSGDQLLLDAALQLMERVLADFDGEGGAFFHTARGDEALITRVREGQDGALPNPNAIAARALARLSYHLGRDDLRRRAVLAISAYADRIKRAPRAFCSTLSVLDFLLETPTELVLVGTPSAADTEAFSVALGRQYLPNRVQALVDPQSGAATPLAQGKTAVNGQATLYVCRNFACQAPIVSTDQVTAALAEHRSGATCEHVLAPI
jgi:hypothetical protein